MARIENTVFISYRRADIYTALAVYENLKNQGYDVFFDYKSVSSGDFEQIITSNIRARAHFLLILTPTALDRCDEPDDWLRREIEVAIDEKRNIVPVFFKGFRFGAPSVAEKLTGKLKNLSRYNGLNVHEDYFDEAMHRLRVQYLSIPLDTVLHPVSTEVQKVVREEQVAADKALERMEDAKELARQADDKKELERAQRPRPVPPRSPASSTGMPWRILGWVVAALLIPIVGVLVARYFFLAPRLGIGSTMVSRKDGMTLLYVPAGSFTMGSDNSPNDNEIPAHTVYLDAFWIDKTEVTIQMYERCVEADVCREPIDKSSLTRPSYYGNAAFDRFPVIQVDWNMANTYCEWVDRRLPTEAEWEKAARGNDRRPYPWGNEVPNNDLLNYSSVVGDTTEVSQYPDGASLYGALNMAGNVSEWVADWYGNDYYSTSPSLNPQGPDSGNDRILRGGSFSHLFRQTNTTFRFWNDPNIRDYYDGFRCAMRAAQ